MRSDILQQAQAIRVSMDAAAAMLNDNQATKAPRIYPLWKAGIAVLEGDRFYYSVTDRLYTTTTLSFQPSTGTVRATKFKGALVGNADTATSAGKATNDAKGQAITSTYIKNASISSNGTSNTLTFTKGDNKTFTVTIPAATDSLAGLITNGEQTFYGKLISNE